MSNNKKVFPLRLTEEQHSLIKGSAIYHDKSIHQYVVDNATEDGLGRFSKAYDLLKSLYKETRGNISSELDEEIFDFLLNAPVKE
jgi:hypothetical protein